MRLLQSNDLPKLLSAQPGPCVSVYLDTRASGRDPQTVRSKWNGLLKEADDLIQSHYTGHRARFLLEPLRLAPDVMAKPPPGADAVALFRSFTTSGYYPVKGTAPELVTVADTFHLKPLLKVIQEQERYFALVLSQRRISLYEGNREGMSPMATFDADYGGPRVNKEDREGKATIDVPRGKRARDSVVHFRPLDRVSRFVELTEPHLWSLLQGESSPLILVGTPFMHRLFRNMSSYPYVSRHAVLASLPHRAELIHSRTWPIAESLFREREIALCERFFEDRQKEKASDALTSIAKASLQGRVATLLVSKGAHLFGALDRGSGEVELRDSSVASLGDDVLDDIAQEVILRKGQAFVLSQPAMPTASPIAAVLRW